jgi:pyruvate/2-oxoacid:ferredoxin oxidoreductase beta subunit
MLYMLENNGVYGLTKGQFSASADIGSMSKKGEANEQSPIDPVLLALTLGATFVARSFSGDKKQLVPIIKAGLTHKGFAIIDVISPCVSFNDHEGSTKSYAFTRHARRCLGSPAFHRRRLRPHQPRVGIRARSRLPGPRGNRHGVALRR